MAKADLHEVLQEVAELMSTTMAGLLPSIKDVREDKLYDAMRYSSLAVGKKIRAFLTITTAKLFACEMKAVLLAASAIEFIHVYSLIHDDLPSMDNDDFRRGKLSCHKKYGEAIAILAGDALLTYAFEILSDIKQYEDPLVCLELIKTIAKAVGFNGMVGGQALDLLSQNTELNLLEIMRLQQMKTGDLFAASCQAGAIIGKASTTQREALTNYSYKIGLAFQITDDLLDIEGSKEQIGKNVNKDIKAGKATVISCVGQNKAREYIKTLTYQAIGHLEGFDYKADLLRDLALFIRERTK